LLHAHAPPMTREHAKLTSAMGGSLMAGMGGKLTLVEAPRGTRLVGTVSLAHKVRTGHGPSQRET